MRMTTDLNLNQTPVTAPVKEPKRKKIASLDRRKARAGWLFILPFLIGFVLIYLPMVKDSIVFSFSKINTATGGGSYTTEFVGWDNYKEALLVDPDFVQTLVSGLKQLAFDIPAIIIFSLFMAVMLNQNMAGRGGLPENRLSDKNDDGYFKTDLNINRKNKPESGNCKRCHFRTFVVSTKTTR